MKLFSIISLSFALLFAQISSAGEKELYLRRVSLLLRGVPPKYEEIESLKFLNEDQFKIILAEKITEYSESDLFNEKMRVRILEMLQMKVTPRLSPELLAPSSFLLEASKEFVSSQISSTVLDQFIIDLLKSNKSWDKLLTGTQYTIDPSSASASTELDFYQNATPKSLAGIITTPRFFERYFSSNSDKNRTRASAIFKIFLCKNISIRPKSMDNNRPRLLNLALNIKSHIAKTSVTNKVSSENTQLDRLGLAFEHSVIRPDPAQVKGYLTYKKGRGNISIPFLSMNQMAQTITKQQEFLSCQTNHFWNWFVGDDVENTKKTQLMNYFDKSQRQPKVLIKKILLDNFDHFKSEIAKKQINPTFGNTYNRTMQNFDFYEAIKFQFKLRPSFLNQCKLTKMELSSLGLVDPQTGLRNPIKPNMTYYQLITACSKQMTLLDFPVIEVAAGPSQWKNYSISEKRNFTLQVIKKILGSQLYSEEITGRLANQIYLIVDDILKNEQHNQDLKFAINTITSYVVLTSEFLRY